MSAHYTITITRWMILRLWPSVWRESLRNIEVNGRALTPWHPLAWVLFVWGAWAIAFSRGDS